MTRFTRLISLSIYAAALAMPLSLSAISQTPHQPTDTEREMAQAIMQVYNDEIAANPAAYEALYRRAAIFYNDGMYLRALQDIDNAIRYIPADNTDLRCAALSLRANIFMMQNQYDKALDDLVIANNLVTDDYILIYQLANAEYECGRYADAKRDYQRLRRLNSRSVEGLVGLARVAIQEHNLGLANDYIDQAVTLAPNDADIYMRRASVRRQLSNNTGATEDYISALSLGESARAVSGIVELSDSDYPAVMSTLSDAISQAPSVGIFYYIRASIAMAHYHYRDALADFDTMVSREMMSVPGIYDGMAQCQLALGQYEAALSNVAIACAESPESGSYLATKARIELAMGRNTEALETAAAAIAAARKAGLKGSEEVMVLRTAAFAQLAVGKAAEAAETLAEAVFDEPLIPDNYLYRASILADDLKDREAARDLCRRAADLGLDTANAESLYGFALLGAGDADSAKKWATEILSAADPHGRANYLCACLYARLGDTESALRCVENALAAGYANYYQWALEDHEPITVAPLRKLPAYEALLARFASLF